MKEIVISDIKQILVLGAGTLGLRVALQAAISGFQVKVYDISENQLTIAKKTQSKLCKSIQKDVRFSKINFEDVLNHITFTSDPVDAARGADLVSESVTEDVELKKKVWAQFGALCPEHTIFTTNTSFLLPSQFSEATGRPSRFCAFHFHDVFVANVVDIMPHATTSPWVVDLLMQLGKRLYQTPIHVAKESNGYIFNFMLINILSSAASLMIKGVGSIEDIDRSWMGNFNMPIGPFGMMDQVGLDTAWHIISAQSNPRNKDFQALLQSYIDQDKLGVKNGSGFYNYPNPAYQADTFISGISS